MGYLGATLTRVSTRVRTRSGLVTQRCHNSPGWETGLASANDVTYRKRTEDLGFSKSQLVDLRSASGEDGWLSLARLGRCRTRWGVGCRWKSQNRKNVYLYPSVEEPLNSKVIKMSYLNWEVVTCFLNFEIPMFYLYGHSMYVSHMYHIMAMVQR